MPIYEVGLDIGLCAREASTLQIVDTPISRTALGQKAGFTFSTETTPPFTSKGSRPEPTFL